MDFRAAFKTQYHAGLKMIRNAIELCPDDLWEGGQYPRMYWRITYHVLYYTHMYLMPSREDFVPWEKAQDNCAQLWDNPPVCRPYTKAEMLEYWAIVDSLVDAAMDNLDLERADSGFSWYEMSKFEHQLVTLRHIQDHAGHLGDRLQEAGIDAWDWHG